MFANEKHKLAYQKVQERALPEALMAFEEALKLSPNNPDIYGDRGVLFIHMKEEQKAMADFNKAIELQPNYSYRYSSRAYAKDFFGDTEGGVADYEKAIELDPDDSVAYNNLGLLQEKLGYIKNAQANFERADKLAKQEDELYSIMDNLETENKPQEAEVIETKKTEEVREPVSPAEMRDTTISMMGEWKKLFTSKKQFGDFLKFLKNGFKIK